MINLPAQLLTERLIIRPLQKEDLSAYLTFMTDERATRYLMFTEEQKTLEGAKELFDAIIASYDSKKPIFAYAIALKDNKFIGSCGISEIAEDEICECYYSLLPTYWKQGYATEATKALIKYCFYNSCVREIRAYISPDNADSFQVAKRVGMSYWGTKKHPLFGNEGKMYSLNRDMLFF
ncbi:MAG: GNAT family N-acetyltransferase [Nostocaceae cyanobacterium]|nr:GNAT family N-acetyltransferase [Nostocaceae cyanobacterium]